MTVQPVRPSIANAPNPNRPPSARPHLAVDLVSADESRQVLEDAIQCISNMSYCEVVQRRIGSMRLVEVLVARLDQDGGRCAEIAIKCSRALATVFWSASPALTAGVRTSVPAIATRLLAQHISEPFVCMKLVSLLAVLSP